MTNHSININDGHLVDRSVDAFHNKSNILFISGANYQSNGGWSLGAFYANYHCHKCIFLNYGLWTYSMVAQTSIWTLTPCLQMSKRRNKKQKETVGPSVAATSHYSAFRCEIAEPLLLRAQYLWLYRPFVAATGDIDDKGPVVRVHDDARGLCAGWVVWGGAATVRTLHTTAWRFLHPPFAVVAFL